MRTLVKRVVMTLVLLVGLAGCASALLFRLVQDHIAAGRARPRLESAPEAASDFVCRTPDGEQRHLGALKGKIVFLDLWGTWCLQCVAEMHTVRRLYEHDRNHPQVEFLIASRLDSPSTVRSYAGRYHLTLPFYVTHDEDIP